MAGGQSRSHRAARVSRRRLNPESAELAVAQDLPVGHAIQCHAARHAEIARPGLLGQGTRHPQHRLVQHRLDGRRHVHVPLLQGFGRLSRAAAE